MMPLDYISTPGEILKSYINDFGYTQKSFAKKINVSERHLSNIINGKAGITINFAMKLEPVFDIEAEYWLNIEIKYKLKKKRENK